MEPMTLFSRNIDPAGAIKKIRELAPSVKVEGPDDAWTKATISLGGWFSKRTLTITHDPDYYAEPGWSTQMNGMANYFRMFPQTPRQAEALMVIATFKFSLGTIAVPEIQPAGDPRLDIILALAEVLDGVVFTPSALLDATGRFLYGAAGDEAEDPAAQWPRVRGEVSLATAEGAAIEKSLRPETPQPPSAKRVARRALALAGVTARAILEHESTKSDLGHVYQDLQRWIDDLDLEGELEPNEWKLLQRPLGKLDPQDHINSVWRLEGLVVVAWALRLFDLPPHDRLVEYNPLWDSLGFLDAAKAQIVLDNAELRPRDEIANLRGKLFAIHWRLRNYYVSPKPMDFIAFARTCTFGPTGPLDLEGLPLVDSDLALGGIRIDRAGRDAFATAHSASQERHQAVNWLWEGPERFSDASVAT